MKIREKKQSIVIMFITIAISLFLIAICYYSPSRYVGDTALYSQITNNIAHTGKAESNIYANTIDFINRNIASMPIEERLNSKSAFTPPEEQSKNILSFHSCLILYLLAPLCYIISPYTCVTIVQCVALALSLSFLIMLLYEKKVPIYVIAAACLLVISHPGWYMPAIYGAFYPERLFMGTGMYLVWVCERQKFSRVHFLLASGLCLLVGERGALYAGMFILAYTIFYWKEKKTGRLFRLVTGGILLAYTGFVMKFILNNVYYSDMSSKFDLGTYLSIPTNQSKVLIFLGINLLFCVLTVFFDWRAFVIAVASMIPNFLYDNGGAEKVGWSLHYHVFYFVFLIWAIAKGVEKLYKHCDKKNNKKIRLIIPIGVLLTLSLIMSLINPYPSQQAVDLNNLKKSIAYNGVKEIYSMYVLGGKNARISFNQFIEEEIPKDLQVTTIEAAMPNLLEHNIYLFPMGIDSADVAIMSYSEKQGQYSFGGSVVYGTEEDKQLFDTQVVDKMQKLGYNFEEATLFPSYGVAIIKRE